MSHSPDRIQHPSGQDCPRTRLAEGPLAAIDICRCGMMQLHLGAVTLRLTPDALSELEETIAGALANHAASRLLTGHSRPSARGAA